MVVSSASAAPITAMLCDCVLTQISADLPSADTEAVAFMGFHLGVIGRIGHIGRFNDPVGACECRVHIADILPERAVGRVSGIAGVRFVLGRALRRNRRP